MTAPLFPAAGISFLRALSANNSREWFIAHKADYEQDVKAPALLLAEALCSELEPLAGTRLSYKIFRIHRDMRFAKGQPPYNTHVRLAFWGEGMGIKNPMAGPSFYLSIEPRETVTGVGALAFTPPALARFRKALEQANIPAGLHRLLDGLKNEGCRLGEPELARTPAAFREAGAQTATLARHKSLNAWHHQPLPVVPEALDIQPFMKAYTHLLPLYRWLVQHMGT